MKNRWIKKYYSTIYCFHRSKQTSSNIIFFLNINIYTQHKFVTEKNLLEMKPKRENITRHEKLHHCFSCLTKNHNKLKLPINQKN